MQLVIYIYIYIWIFTIFILPGEEAHLETIELFTMSSPLPPYIDLKYSNQGKQKNNKIHKNKNKRT